MQRNEGKIEKIKGKLKRHFSNKIESKGKVKKSFLESVMYLRFSRKLKQT
jgi:hypothetical protein